MLNGAFSCSAPDQSAGRRAYCSTATVPPARLAASSKRHWPPNELAEATSIVDGHDPLFALARVCVHLRIAVAGRTTDTCLSDCRIVWRSRAPRGQLRWVPPSNQSERLTATGPRIDHQQARQARPAGVDDHQDPHDRGPEDARPGRGLHAGRRPDRPLSPRAVGRHRLSGRALDRRRLEPITLKRRDGTCRVPGA